MPKRADAWLWEAWVSPFHKVGGFEKREPELAALVAESLKRYPLGNFIAVVKDAALQFVLFQTGDGIVPQEWVLNQEFKIAIPQQISDYDHAYQQEGAIWFLPVNLVHVPVAFLALLTLGLLLRHAVKQGEWRKGMLPGFRSARFARQCFRLRRIFRSAWPLPVAHHVAAGLRRGADRVATS